MSRTTSTPRRVSGSPNGDHAAAGTSPTAGGIGLGRPSTSPLATGTEAGHRYTSLSSLMRSPDRDHRMEWPGSPPGANSTGPGAGTGTGTGTGTSMSPRHAHFGTASVTRYTSRGEAAAHDAESVPPWTIPGSGEPARVAGPKRDKRHLSLWRLIALTVAMGGSQIVWTVELGYGTPYLTGLGMPTKYTALVWLAGPISGLVVQPLIGAISDSSTSKYRRRFWVVASTALLVLSLLGLAYAGPIAKALVDLIGVGQGDWDPQGKLWTAQAAIALAVFCFYMLDFALNGLQASLRNLVFDVTPADQLNSANAWNGRFNHIGSIVGFSVGFINLNDIGFISFLGGEQFRKLCILSMLILLVTVWITCFTTEEDERPSPLLGERRSTLRQMLNTIHEAILTLPKPVRRICMVQIMAFMGWFPFLFYATHYMKYVMSHELGREAGDEATRTGSLALMFNAFVAYAAGTILPYLSERDHRLLPEADELSEDEEDEHAHIRSMVQQWKADVDRTGRPLRLPRMPFMLRNVWTAALLLFFVLMMSTFFIVTVWQATIMISLVGICWAVACWVPFEMIMAFLKEVEEEQNRAQTTPSSSTVSRSHGRSASFSTHTNINLQSSRPSHSDRDRDSERRPLLMRSYSTADMEGASVEYIGQGPVAGGTIMGIHNLAIVLPQFIIAIVASIIFRVADGDAKPVSSHGEWQEKSGVAWVLRFGGLMALVGAAICRRVPPTKQEKIMRRRLAEIREAAED